MIGSRVLEALLLLALRATVATCLPVPPAAGVGVADPFRPPAPKATALNAAAKTLYRQGQWDAARAQYRAAEAADPDFLAPRLNVACSFVRQERFPEAAAEVRALLDRAYVPWAREVLEAADLGALKVRPEGREIARAISAAAAAWGAGLDQSLVFVGRQRAPLRVPAEGAGSFILNPHQEAYAFLPATGRFRQLTAEDGHVLAVARSADRRRLAVVSAQTLVRGSKPHELWLDRVSIGELTLATMAAAPSTALDGRVRRIEIAARGDGFAYRIEGEHTNGWFAPGSDGRWQPAPDFRAAGPLTILTPEGTAPAKQASADGACAAIAHDVKPAGAPRAVSVAVRGRPPLIIGGADGAGLLGLPIP